MNSDFSGIGTLFYPFLLFVLVALAVLVPLKTRANALKPKMIFIILPFALLLLSSVAYFLNLGLIRIVLTFFPIIPVHAILFLASCFYSADLASEKRAILVLTIINYIIYPLTYILLPDGADYGYMFFGLIENETIIEIAWFVAFVLGIVSFLLLITQFFLSDIIKHKRKKAVE